jgi:hypothetical protein
MTFLEYEVPQNPNPQYSNEGGTLIDIDVFFPHLNKTVRYTAGQTDCNCGHSEEIFKRAKSGEFGPIAPLIFPSKEEVELEVRHKRNGLLSQSDWSQLPDVPEAIIGPWAIYRQALRDVPQQQGFPFNVEWPQTP